MRDQDEEPQGELIAAITATVESHSYEFRISGEELIYDEWLPSSEGMRIVGRHADDVTLMHSIGEAGPLADPIFLVPGHYLGQSLAFGESGYRCFPRDASPFEDPAEFLSGLLLHVQDVRAISASEFEFRTGEDLGMIGHLIIRNGTVSILTVEYEGAGIRDTYAFSDYSDHGQIETPVVDC